MEYLFESYYSWWQFLLIAITLFVIYVLINRYKRFLYYSTGFHSLHIPISILVILLVLSFILINPLVNGLLVGVGFILFYPIISAYLKGIIVSNNSKIDIGDLIKVGKDRGKISEINLSGIKILTESNNLFIPYSKLSNEVIEKYQSNQSRYLSFICRPNSEEKKISFYEVERIVFNFPFLESGSKIEMDQLDNAVKVELTLANDRFKTSLGRHFSNEGYLFEQITNNQ